MPSHDRRKATLPPSSFILLGPRVLEPNIPEMISSSLSLSSSSPLLWPAASVVELDDLGGRNSPVRLLLTASGRAMSAPAREGECDIRNFLTASIFIIFFGVG